jgi:chemotaxis protein methyltransferase CheR
MSLSAGEFDYVRNLVYRHAGITLERGKEYLVESRLSPLARQEGFPSLHLFIAGLRSGALTSLQHRVVQAMATSETSFFRDGHPFEALKRFVLPALLTARAGERSLNLWCAAASTGQEPYTIAMLIRENFSSEVDGWNIRFIASDLSTEVLARAIQGRYSQPEVNRGLPARMLIKYFEPADGEWQIKPELRRGIEFRELNLTERWPSLPRMDVIFMRNVLIYFGAAAKKDVLDRAHMLLRPGGFLFLGSSETMLGLDDCFEAFPPDHPVCYRLRRQ